MCNGLKAIVCDQILGLSLLLIVSRDGHCQEKLNWPGLTAFEPKRDMLRVKNTPLQVRANANGACDGLTEVAIAYFWMTAGVGVTLAEPGKRIEQT